MGLGQSWDRREEGVKAVRIRPFGEKSIFKLPFSYLLPSEDTNEEHLVSADAVSGTQLRMQSHFLI